jgi:hypothetical protein
MPQGTWLTNDPLETVLVPRPDERTAELIHEETTNFPDDLTDPRNPRHAEWEASQKAAIAEGLARTEAAAASEDHETPKS